VARDTNGARQTLLLDNAGHVFGDLLRITAGVTTLRAAGDLMVELDTAGETVLNVDDALTLQGVVAGGGNLVVTAGSVAFASTVISGALDVTSGGGVTQTAALDVTGASVFDARGAITLSDTANRFAGGLEVRDAAAVTLAAAGDLALNGVFQSRGAVQLQVSGAVTLDGAPIGVGALTVSAGTVIEQTATVGSAGAVRYDAPVITLRPGSAINSTGGGTLTLRASAATLVVSELTTGGAVVLDAGRQLVESADPSIAVNVRAATLSLTAAPHPVSGPASQARGQLLALQDRLIKVDVGRVTLDPTPAELLSLRTSDGLRFLYSPAAPQGVFLLAVGRQTGSLDGIVTRKLPLNAYGLGAHSALSTASSLSTRLQAAPGGGSFDSRTQSAEGLVSPVWIDQWMWAGADSVRVSALTHALDRLPPPGYFLGVDTSPQTAAWGSDALITAGERIGQMFRFDFHSEHPFSF